MHCEAEDRENLRLGLLEKGELVLWRLQDKIWAWLVRTIVHLSEHDTVHVCLWEVQVFDWWHTWLHPYTYIHQNSRITCDDLCPLLVAAWQQQQNIWTHPWHTLSAKPAHSVQPYRLHNACVSVWAYIGDSFAIKEKWGRIITPGVIRTLECRSSFM